MNLAIVFFIKFSFDSSGESRDKGSARQGKNSNFYFVSIRLFLILTFLCVTGHFRAKNSKFGKTCANESVTL